MEKKIMEKKIMEKKKNRNSFRKELTAANGITLFRLLLIPVIMYFLAQEQHLATIIILAVALLSDSLDGYLARKFQQISTFGKHFDQCTDKALFTGVLFVVLWKYASPFWWIAYAVLLSISFIIIFFIVKKNLQVTPLNRVFMWLQSLILLVIIFGHLNSWSLGLLWMLLFVPAVDYWKKNRRSN